SQPVNLWRHVRFRPCSQDGPGSRGSRSAPCPRLSAPAHNIVPKRRRLPSAEGGNPEPLRSHTAIANRQAFGAPLHIPDTTQRDRGSSTSLMLWVVSVRLNGAWNHDGVFHAMNHFFIRRDNRSQNTSQVSVFASDEVVRRQSHASGHRTQLAGDRLEVIQLDLLTLVKFLQDVRVMVKGLKCRSDSGGPFALRQVVSHGYTTAAPGQL